MNRLGQSSTVILIHSKLKVLLGDGFIHPLALDTHVPAPVHMRLCKSDEQKRFSLDQFQVSAICMCKGCNCR